MIPRVDNSDAIIHAARMGTDCRAGVEPLVGIHEQFAPFAGRERWPDWFEKYRTPATVFGVSNHSELDRLTECGFSYLSTYLELIAKAEPIGDAERLARIGEFSEQFREDIREKDRGRGVLEKLTNAETARRMFYEVAT